MNELGGGGDGERDGPSREIAIARPAPVAVPIPSNALDFSHRRRGSSIRPGNTGVRLEIFMITVGALARNREVSSPRRKNSNTVTKSAIITAVVISRAI